MGYRDFVGVLDPEKVVKGVVMDPKRSPPEDEFRSKVACENDVLQLKCNPNSRIAVYSASFGRTEYESVRCPQPQGVREETCLVSYATETVMQICHGKRRCTLSADASTFGNPCQKESRMYLKVVYTCVPRKVLREQYEDRLEDDEHLEGEYLDMDYDAVDDLFREPDSFSPSPNLAGNLSGLLPQRPSSPPPPSQPHKEDKLKGVDSRSAESYRRMAKDIQGDSESKSAESSRVINCSVTIYTNSRTRVIGFISEWINTYNFLTQNQEKLYLYLIVSVCFGLLSLLSLVIGRLLWQRHVTRRRLNKDGGPGVTTLPNGFADDISEIDADIDLTSVNVNSPAITILPAQGHSPSEVVRYAGSGDVTAPRSLSRSAVNSSQYYYG
ncbi:uncharacterized protein LOC120352153 [Nilaparvata lugens]|uniref:uncharacterized protein LOC120352153 n=2 Tax=Nilaparvata lugens TaxID=108931 RepID=UPI00193E3D68|nr:uncharacterized protein LOC120352153 [Nilaparvata lugens]